MNSIDFSKAPEGATHYSSVGCFYKMVDGVVMLAMDDEGQKWEKSNDYASLNGLTQIFEPFTSCEDAQPAGSKHDSGKPLMGAVPPNALLAVANVLTFGVEKYGRDNWPQVENAEIRYMDAALRHINAYQRGEQLDPESGENHLAHAVCSLMFILEKETRPSITPEQKEFADGVLDRFKHLSGAEKALSIGQYLMAEQIAKLK